MASKDTQPNDCKGQTNPLHVWRRENEEATRLITRLMGEQLPDVKLQMALAGWEQLHALTSGVTVIYFIPGEGYKWKAGRPPVDGVQHRSYVKRKSDFEAMRVKVICVSSQAALELLSVCHYFGCTHPMLADPELQIGQALGLPIEQNGDVLRYRRLTLVTMEKTIIKVFYPVRFGGITGNAHQVSAWIGAELCHESARPEHRS